MQHTGSHDLSGDAAPGPIVQMVSFSDTDTGSGLDADQHPTNSRPEPDVFLEDI